MTTCHFLILLLTCALVESCGGPPPPPKDPVEFTCGHDEDLLDRTGPGQDDVDEEGRIIGGDEADQHAIPWQVGIVSRWSKWKPFCGGTIISPYHILTAAHCTWVPNIWVIVGEHDITISQQFDNSTFHKVECIENHPTYDMRPLDNDFAILTLEDPIDLSHRARAACLPPADLAPFVPGVTTFTVSGWGLIEEGGDVQSQVLHHAQIPYYDRQVCADAYANITDYPGLLTENMMCAGHADGGIDSCQGDSGGPLTLDVAGVDYVVGVVSWGIGCGRPNLPGVYAKVTSQLDWIRSRGINATTAENKCPQCQGLFCIFG